MKQLNRLEPSKLGEIGDRFLVAMDRAYEVFDRDSFRKRYSEDDGRKPVSKALFEAWSVNLANLSSDEINILAARAEDVRKAFRRLMQDDRFFDVAISSSTGTVQRVHKRFEAIENLISHVLSGESENADEG